MRTTKKTNLLKLSSQLLAESQMQSVHGGKMEMVYDGVGCGPSDCKDASASVRNALKNMRENNPPIQHPIGTF